MSASSAKRQARIGRLRRIAEKRVLAAETEATRARAREAEADAAAGAAEAVAERALDAWGVVASAWELAEADARRTTLGQEAARARGRVASFTAAVARADAVLVGERVGEQQLAKVIERLAQADAARATVREQRAADEHAARVGSGRDGESDVETSERGS